MNDAARELPAIEIKDVSVRFGGLTALDTVNAVIAVGDSFGIIGPNGAGKTTLLNVVSGLLRPSSGDVRYRGQRITGLRASRIAQLGLGRSFQLAEGFANFTVIDYVQLGMAAMAADGRSRMTGIRRIEECLRALEQVGLRPVAGKLMGTLPYGVKKLVDLCRVVVSRPAVLLLDEPTSGLSSDERAEMVGHLAAFKGDAQSPRTVVVVDHDVEFISSVTERVLALAHGQVLTDGSPDEVLSDSRVVDAYMG